MPDTFEKQDGNADLWHTVFALGHPALQKKHRLHRILPREPRCRMCLAPFAGIGGWWAKRTGKAPSSRNPHYCAQCDGFIEAFPGGAEVDMAILFIDIRGSTSYAQDADPAQVQARITAFLDQATQQITDNDGFIMAFYGDCVVAVFPPGFSGPDYATKAIAAARALLKNPARDASGKTIEAGVGVHAGPIFIGTVAAAKGLFRDVSVFGHCVNLCAKLADTAPAHRAHISTDLADQAGLSGDKINLTLKGIDTPVTALIL